MPLTVLVVESDEEADMKRRQFMRPERQLLVLPLYLDGNPQRPPPQVLAGRMLSESSGASTRFINYS
ncbi:hypothetical protein [Nocardia wallacei]|uniref:hypothetical protein n=1 Tax=Nocardia wallacei TaxID=480035 RepID=UPI002457D902|nr:hypothetical protein [Nocardia wallacei]